MNRKRRLTSQGISPVFLILQAPLHNKEKCIAFLLKSRPVNWRELDFHSPLWQYPLQPWLAAKYSRRRLPMLQRGPFPVDHTGHKSDKRCNPDNRDRSWHETFCFMGENVSRHNESAGKRKRGRTCKGKQKVQQLLCEISNAARYNFCIFEEAGGLQVS